MNTKELTKVTIIYYEDHSLELMHDIKSYTKNATGRVIIPASYKEGKSIIAVCLGEITIMNKVGDRIIAADVAD
ncbi:MAG: TIGR02922 family protein [Colwellia sp.]|nr:TIGR02922 family protein [Colwellia sp.]